MSKRLLHVFLLDILAVEYSVAEVCTLLQGEMGTVLAAAVVRKIEPTHVLLAHLL